MSYCSAYHWWNQYYRLGRKIETQGGTPTPFDVRKAALLRQTMLDNPYRNVPLKDAFDSMEWVIDYGREAFEAELARRKAEKGMGS